MTDNEFFNYLFKVFAREQYKYQKKLTLEVSHRLMSLLAKNFDKDYILLDSTSILICAAFRELINKYKVIFINYEEDHLYRFRTDAFAVFDFKKGYSILHYTNDSKQVLPSLNILKSWLLAWDEHGLYTHLCNLYLKNGKIKYNWVDMTIDQTFDSKKIKKVIKASKEINSIDQVTFLLKDIFTLYR